MNHGEVKCCGSPLFLEKNFGNGLKIRIFKTADYNKTGFGEILQHYSDEFKIEADVEREIALSFPSDKLDVLSSFLNEVEVNKERLGLDRYDISSCTIEEVFLK